MSVPGDAARAPVGLGGVGVPAIAAARSARRILADLVLLTKPRIVLMVLVTTVVGYEMALREPGDGVRLVRVVLGTALAAAGTLALNQHVERDVDALMARTRGRPLPRRRLSPREALLFSTSTTAAGIVFLGATVDHGAALVAAVTSVVYLFVYTPLKRRTSLSTLIGAVPGALPPLIGWLGARDALDAGAWALFGILYFWQLPHTLAIGRLHRDDYAQARVWVLGVREWRRARRLPRIGTAVLASAATFVPAVLGLAGPSYVVGAAVAGGALIAVAASDGGGDPPRAARRLLLASVLYLPFVLTLLVVGRT